MNPTGGPLSHVKVLDLSRILAAPWAGQILADLGAEVTKVERPGAGDDTRSWGPPFLKDANGKDTKEAGYYLAVNRGKRSITLSLDKAEGQRIVRELASQSDIVLENYKAGTLERYGLDEASLVAMAGELSLPGSVVEFMQGYIGQPAFGFPEPLRSRVLKGRTLPNGKSSFAGRPGAEMPALDFGKVERALKDCRQVGVRFTSQTCDLLACAAVKAGCPAAALALLVEDGGASRLFPQETAFRHLLIAAMRAKTQVVLDRNATESPGAAKIVASYRQAVQAGRNWASIEAYMAQVLRQA